ncbi:MAG TPA: GNAT family protein [Nitrososphaerales archaeon]|nr:GNAT family protein [Nitrososphaerales archaeon]
MELFGEKVSLKPLSDSDVDDFYNWWNDPEFSGEYAGFEPMSRANVQELVGKEEWFMIFTRLGGRKVGFISYYLVRRDYLNLFEIGYRTKPSERRKGYTTEAARLLVDHLFSSKKEIERIESVTDVDNVPSQRVLEKNGFRREAELRKRFFNKGEYRNEYMYSLLREEWQNAK